MLEIIFLSGIQGVTEFLPISSTAHLILFSKYFNFNNESLTLDISLHLGSLLATVTYFRTDLLNFVENKKLFYKIIVSSVPVLVFGYILIKFNIIDHLRSYKLIGWSTILFGVLLYFSDLIKIKKTFKKNFTYGSALYIGLFQMLSLIPGVSRSGITITAARFLNFNRTESAKISFLVSIPVLMAVSIYNLQDLITEKTYEITLMNLFGIALSFFFSYLTIKFFLQYLKRFSLLSFVVYRLILGIIILFYAY